MENFCYPAGHYDEAAIAELRRAGYRGATTELPGLADGENPYTLARVEIQERRPQRVRPEVRSAPRRARPASA